MTNANYLTATNRWDGRTRRAKRLRSLIAGLARDLGHQPSTAEQALIEQAASLIVQREAMEVAMTAGEAINAQEITKISGAVTRCLATLCGKGRNRRMTTTTIRERLAAGA
ncbi:hypothetical protein [Bradyrhizobium sp. RDM4]|uniref:hypothetical protein n=1 Tax=Bradyrhizobium sp. RDM4 TaxID=3378765 RepID=UPI0038FCADAC